MKTKVVTFLIATIVGNVSCFSQDREVLATENAPVYSVIYNSVQEDFPFPLIGFYNQVKGDYYGLELGVINNNNKGRVNGLQSGFLNTANSIYGFQEGFVNEVMQEVRGLQSGFVNQAEHVLGVQSGFINATNRMTGLQSGFINSTNSLKGVQLGFINSVDSIEAGVPIGFLSFVKKGGYKVIEVGYNTVYPVNIAFKTGIRAFYTYPILAFDTRLDDDQLGFGFGAGSNIDLKNGFFVNPELEFLHQVSLDFNHFSIAKCNVGYSAGEHLELVAGPTVVWHVKINADDFHQNYTEFDPSIIAINNWRIGFDAAVRFKF